MMSSRAIVKAVNKKLAGRARVITSMTRSFDYGRSVGVSLSLDCGDGKVCMAASLFDARDGVVTDVLVDNVLEHVARDSVKPRG